MSLFPPKPFNAEGQTVEGGHRFVLDESGHVDAWQLEAENHNGPRCLACRDVWCENCDQGIYTEKCPVASMQDLLL